MKACVIGFKSGPQLPVAGTMDLAAQGLIATPETLICRDNLCIPSRVQCLTKFVRLLGKTSGSKARWIGLVMAS